MWRPPRCDDSNWHCGKAVVLLGQAHTDLAEPLGTLRSEGPEEPELRSGVTV